MTQFYKEQNKELVVRIQFKQNLSQGKMRMRR